MQFLIIIEYIVGFLTLIYIGGLISVWLCEMQRNIFYHKMQQRVRLAENFHVSMAVLHIKKYKINRDYYQKIDKIERVQHFILKKMLLAKRSSLKNMPMRQNG